MAFPSRVVVISIWVQSFLFREYSAISVMPAPSNNNECLFWCVCFVKKPVDSQLYWEVGRERWRCCNSCVDKQKSIGCIFIDSLQETFFVALLIAKLYQPHAMSPVIVWAWYHHMTCWSVFGCFSFVGVFFVAGNGKQLCQSKVCKSSQVLWS